MGLKSELVQVNHRSSAVTFLIKYIKSLTEIHIYLVLADAPFRISAPNIHPKRGWLRGHSPQMYQKPLSQTHKIKKLDREYRRGRTMLYKFESKINFSYLAFEELWRRRRGILLIS